MSAAPTRTYGVTLDDVLAAVAAYYGMTTNDLRGDGREHYKVEARHMFFLLGARVVGSTCGRMSAWLGGRSRWNGINAMRRVRVRFETNPRFREAALQVETGLRAIGELREDKRLRGVGPREPLPLARAILVGGDRVAMGASVEEIRLMAAELLALHDALEAERQPEEEPEEEDDPPPLAPEPAPKPIVQAKSEAVDALVHDFVGIEAFLRSTPSGLARKARDQLVEEMRAHRGESGAVDAVVSAFDAMRKAEFTACERGATESYRAAVRTLANGFLKSKEIAANG